MPSITYWSRLEPRPRSNSIEGSLRAEVRDPAWMLGRQWQFGEFRGEDAGSPVAIQVAGRRGSLQLWSTPGQSARALAEAPLDAQLLDDSVQEELSLAVELGQIFADGLRKAQRLDLLNAFIQAYPIDESAFGRVDQSARRFLSVVRQRCVDGLALYRAYAGNRPFPPQTPALVPSDQSAALAALEDLYRWVAQTVGPLGSQDAPTWQPERLDYDLTLHGKRASGHSVELRGSAGVDGRLSWSAFDAKTADDDASLGEEFAVNSLPVSVSFLGMPRARWWAFEDGATNLAMLRPNKSELAKLIVLDFMLLHSNDWYLVPLELPLGSLAELQSVSVIDVFEQSRAVASAESIGTAQQPQWAMYTTSEQDSNHATGVLFLAPVAGGALQAGEAREVVAFVRDEAANLVWGIEGTTPNALGEPQSDTERAPQIAEPLEGADSEAPLAYRIQTDIPGHWVPFVPVRLAETGPEIVLERAGFQRDLDESSPIVLHGRVLRPSSIGQAPYRIHEEEVTTLGLRVELKTHRCRWIDGSTHTWRPRARSFVGAESQSGLRFDLARE